MSNPHVKKLKEKFEKNNEILAGCVSILEDFDNLPDDKAANVKAMIKSAAARGKAAREENEDILHLLEFFEIEKKLKEIYADFEAARDKAMSNDDVLALLMSKDSEEYL